MIIQTIINIIEAIIVSWWWLILAIILYFPVRVLYKFWITWDVFQKEFQWVVLEMIPPSEAERPYRAMEHVFARLWTIYDGPCWRELWCEGEDYLAFWWSFEVASFGGEVHFYIRVLKGMEQLVESTIHAYYPDVEIFEVEDYVNRLPRNLPNEKYRVYGEDYEYQLGPLFPINTYKTFEAKVPESVEGEKKIDPMNDFLEAMAQLKPGQTFLFQMILAPTTDKEIPWQTDGKKKVEELARREIPKKRSIVGESFRLLFQAKMPFEEEKQEGFVIPPEMKLTPGERETLAILEEKITKLGCRTNMRIIYMAERDKYHSPHAKIIRGYLANFSNSRNYLMYHSLTRTRIHYWFRKRRLYQRKKSILDRYVKRLPPHFPNIYKGMSVLNVEELATIFHFPAKASLLPPEIPRVVVRKREAPPGIPTE